MSETPKLLPLGSAVKIEDDEGIYVIIARGFQKQENGLLAGYKGVPHPQGAGAGVREIVFRGAQIKKVVHRGHEDDADVAFNKDQIENAKPPAQAPAPAAEAPGPAAGEPKTTAAAPPAIVKDTKDPFSELRSKGKRV